MNQEVTAPKEMNESASNDLLTTSLKNITRLNTNDPLQMAVLTSQTIWPATHKENQPGAIIFSTSKRVAIRYCECGSYSSSE